MKKIIFILLVFLLAPIAYGATLYGTVYSFDLIKLENVKVELNTTPIQRDITENGSYSFIVQSGIYELKAEQYEDGILIAESKETITIAKEGDFILDLILFPVFEELETIEDEEIDILVEERNWVEFVFIVLFLILMFALVYYFNVKPEEEKTTKLTKELDKADTQEDDLQKIIKFIKQEGGRTTQKELRKKFPYSEGKMSLMIADLEDQGKIKKIKRGRGNILILQ